MTFPGRLNSRLDTAEGIVIEWEYSDREFIQSLTQRHKEMEYMNVKKKRKERRANIRLLKFPEIDNFLKKESQF